MDEERYAFEVTWYDNLAEISRRFMLMYFVRHTGDNEVEMIDLKTNKKFLKRCPYSSITLQDLYIGSTVSIFSRQLHVVAYSDPFTQRVLGSRQSKTVGIVAAAGIKHLGKALSASAAAGLSVKNLRMLYLSADEAASVFPSRGDLNGVFSDAAIVIELVGENASSQWSNIACKFTTVS
jgi:nucleoside-diphosphate kinase